MRKPPQLFLLGAFATLVLLVPASANAQSGGSVEPRVVGGSTASVVTYPWQAAVVYSISQKPGRSPHQRQFCGGSLLTSRIVVTAGHCVANDDPDCSTLCAVNDPGGDGTSKMDPDDVDVILGRSTLSDTGNEPEHEVSAVVLRSNYDGDYQGTGVPRFDVAYLVLSAASAQTPIKIAGTDEGALWDPGSTEDVSGWGTTSETGDTVDTLRAATGSVISDPVCSGIYSNAFDPGTMVCAGALSGAVDTCFGDSGGPLEAPLQGGGYRLIGITGWGDGCGRPDAPGVYTRVAGPTMRSLIASDVSTIDSDDDLPAESIFGSGGQPLSAAAPPSAGNVGSPPKKCKRIRIRKKRRHCAKRIRARGAA